MGELFSGEEPKAPITSEPLPDVAEIRGDVARLVERHRGQELVDEITGYCALSLMEVYLIRDPDPNRLEQLKPEKIQILKLLAPEFKPRPAD